jgi:hypothetical protein
MATIITGLSGSLTLPNDASSNAIQWPVASITLSTGHELLDVTHYGGNGWRRRVAGIKDLSGTGVAFLAKDATGTNPFNLSTTGSNMTITYASGCYVTFSAIIGNITIAGEYAGLNILTFSFAKADDAAVTPTWDQS